MVEFLLRCVREPLHVTTMLFKCLFCWGTPRPVGDASSAQVICVQACGDLADGTTSQTNASLAYTAAEYRNVLGLPLLAQGEVADALSRMSVRSVVRTATQEELRKSGKPYMNTYHVAIEHLKCCKANGWSRVIVVGYAPSHVWRCIWTYERLGLTVILPSEMPSIIWGEHLYQKRLRTPLTHFPFEVCARLFFLYRGYI